MAATNAHDMRALRPGMGLLRLLLRCLLARAVLLELLDLGREHLILVAFLLEVQCTRGVAYREAV